MDGTHTERYQSRYSFIVRRRASSALRDARVAVAKREGIVVIAVVHVVAAIWRWDFKVRTTRYRTWSGSDCLQVDSFTFEHYTGFLDLTLWTRMVRGTGNIIQSQFFTKLTWPSIAGKYKQKRGGGRSFRYVGHIQRLYEVDVSPFGILARICLWTQMERRLASPTVDCKAIAAAAMI
jgi:hypothetical protein